VGKCVLYYMMWVWFVPCSGVCAGGGDVGAPADLEYTEASEVMKNMGRKTARIGKFVCVCWHA